MLSSSPAWMFKLFIMQHSVAKLIFLACVAIVAALSMLFSWFTSEHSDLPSCLSAFLHFSIFIQGQPAVGTSGECQSLSNMKAGRSCHNANDVRGERALTEATTWNDLLQKWFAFSLSLKFTSSPPEHHCHPGNEGIKRLERSHPKWEKFPGLQFKRQTARHVCLKYFHCSRR